MITLKRPANGNRPLKACPICGKPAAPQFRPFCSKTCADIDLGNWLGENYRLPDDDENSEGNSDSPRFE